MSNIEQTTKPAELIDGVAAELGITMHAEFVPWSRSRNKAEKEPSLNWLVFLSRHGRQFLATDYSAGCGHCPSYKQLDRRQIMADTIEWECENGRKAFRIDSIDRIMGTSKPIMPQMRDVLYSLAMDSSVLDESSFEDWVSSLGYETDSRKAESIYRACLSIALKLRSALGEDGLNQLRAACQDY